MIHKGETQVADTTWVEISQMIPKEEKQVADTIWGKMLSREIKTLYLIQIMVTLVGVLAISILLL